MKKVLFCCAVLIFAAGSYAQELKIVDSYYKSVFNLPSNGLTIDEIVAAFELNEMEYATPTISYKNEAANIVVVEFAYNWLKDPVGRWWNLIIPCKCILKGESVKVVVENFLLESYSTMDANSGKFRSVFEKGKNATSEENRLKIEPVIMECRLAIETVLKDTVSKSVSALSSKKGPAMFG
ncbi:MAG: hypothetical protein IKY84_08750 [Bacteroidaceae bacterium]|nr:hypothetical protein [Bacteroidaceae bacterium]